MDPLCELLLLCTLLLAFGVTVGWHLKGLVQAPAASPGQVATIHAFAALREPVHGQLRSTNCSTISNFD